ncbi:MAG: putative membrane protein YfcA [Verrucomicrobiales bacterium]
MFTPATESLHDASELDRGCGRVDGGAMLHGYLAALIMGLTLGMIGAGGSILTVPILVYLFGVDPLLSTAYSLFVVGATAGVGAIAYARAGLIDYRSALVFGLPSVVSVFAVRLWIVPNLPEKLLGLERGTFVLVVLAVVMIAAAVSMIRPARARVTDGDDVGATLGGAWLVTIEGLVVGAVTGFVGAGGGFLIVPALVHFLRLPMRRAVGTSLFVIACKSLVGFCGDLGGSQEIEWRFLLGFAAVSCVGIGIGVWCGSKVPAKRLKVGFGWLVLLTGIAICVVELL